MKKSIVVLGVMLFFSIVGCNKGEEAIAEKTEVLSGTEVMFTEISDTNEIVLSDKVSDVFLEEVEPERRELSKYYKYNALNQMVTTELEKNSFFCVDETTGAICFVNEAKDYFIYRVKNGSAELAVELPAKELCAWDGMVYFMLDTYNTYKLSGGKTGDIYAYNLSDGTVKLVYEAGELLGEIAQKLYCDKDGLYFSSGIIEENNGHYILKEKFYHLPYGQTEPLEDKNKTTLPGWENFYLEYNQKAASFQLYNRDESLSETRILGIDGIKQCCCIGNELFFLKGCTVGVKNIISEEIELFEFQPLLDTGGALEMLNNVVNGNLECFTVVEENIWAVLGGTFLLKMNMQTKEVMAYQISQSIVALCTTGDALYAKVRSTSGKNEVIQINVNKEIMTENQMFPSLETTLLIK